jgi:cleavage stimulation factor subunit 3
MLFATSPHAPLRRSPPDRVNNNSNDDDVMVNVAAHALPIVLERFFALFPTASSAWARVVDAQLSAGGDNAKAKAWAERALTACGGAAAAPVTVWAAVLRAARAVHSIDTPTGREAVQTCFENAVAACGGDVNALVIWREYLEFVRVAGDAAQLEDTRRMTALRSLYQRALSQPLLELELLWRQYDAFEQKISKVLAKGLLQEHSARYMVARQCGRQLAVHGAGVDLDMFAVPPTGRLNEPMLAAAWQRLIAFERTNPAQLDDAGCAQRVARVYEQCLLVMRHYPHVWFDYSATRAGANDAAGARAILTRAVAALPTSALLSFALAQTLELAGEVDAALRTLDQLLEKAPSPIAWARAIQVTARAQSREAARKLFMRARKSPQCSWQPYVIAAQLELDDRELKVARNIFEFGLREHANEPLFVEQYVELLLAAGRPQDARALLERVLATSADDSALPIWNLLVRVERASGDAAAERTAETRRAERYAELDPSVVAQRARALRSARHAGVLAVGAGGWRARRTMSSRPTTCSRRCVRDRAPRPPTQPQCKRPRPMRAAELEAIRKAAESLPRPDIDSMTPFLPLEDPDAAGGAGTALGAAAAVAARRARAPAERALLQRTDHRG